MAPWPDRGGAPRRPPDPISAHGQHLTPQHAHGGPPVGRYRSASRVSEIDVWDNMQNHHLQGDSSSEGDLHPRSATRSRPRHVRHSSFPSLFSSKKKKKPSPMADADDSWSEPGDEGVSSKGKPASAMLGHRNGSSVGGWDFATGRCMTCGSLVRWPKELQMFRCTICMTINDLQPLHREPRREDAREVAVTFEEPSGGSERTISLAYTRSLVEQCLRSFLIFTLKRQSPGGSASGQEPPASASFLSPDYIRSPAPSDGAPVALRPKASLNFEPRPAPGSPRSPVLHRRAPSWAGTTSRPYSTSFPDKVPPLHDLPHPGSGSGQSRPPPSPGEEARRIFRPLDDYITSCFTSFHCLNSSFLIPKSHSHGGHGGHGGNGGHGDDDRPRRPSEHTEVRREVRSTSYPIPEIDPKLLLLGDFAENGTWWTGQEDVRPGRTPSGRNQTGPSIVSSRSPHIDWAELDEWYKTVTEAARPWSDVYESLVAEDPALTLPPAALQNIEAQILAGQEHAQRVLLKASETILKRPGRRITNPQELRFLLIIAANPLLHASHKPYAGKLQAGSPLSTPSGAYPRSSGPVSGRHSVIIKRIVGLMSNTPIECHNHLVAWFARYSEPSFIQTKDLVAGFLTYRLVRQNEKKYEAQIDYTGGLIPNIGPSHSAASLHAALGQTQRSNKKKLPEKKRVVYQEDWQIKAAAQVLSFLFAANNMGHVRRGTTGDHPDSPGNRHRELVQAPGQTLATSDFYVTLLDDADLVAEFEAWERKQGRFSFCQYPFLLSIGAKIQILEYDAKRQMENMARDAFFDSILSNRMVQQFLVLNIRRECLVDDSLKAVSEVIGGGSEEIKKGLKINFKGEEGVDAGGLRKEWFLLLVREVFNPDHGMFLYDEDSQYCYFNPNSLEPSEQFFLVGVVLGLAIYNSTILDVAFPPFAFRKLLHAAPPALSPTAQLRREPMTYTLDDLAEYRPRLAHGLRQLLTFEGDVESTFCLDFTLDTSRYGAIEKVPLCPNGAHRPVTNANRKEYVDAYVRYLLDTSVSRQFEPFKRGFYTVCANSGPNPSSSNHQNHQNNQSPPVNALSLFRPEEIELLIRGSTLADQPLDIPSLKAVASYDGWTLPNPASSASSPSKTKPNKLPANPAEDEPTVRFFWDAFERAQPKDQRRLLAFITGSDRIPAMGAASLGIRVVCLGEECGRFPTARTCFNSVGLWRVRADTEEERARFEGVLWRAVGDSEGFGLK